MDGMSPGNGGAYGVPGMGSPGGMNGMPPMGMPGMGGGY
jgi:hypothetical protein